MPRTGMGRDGGEEAPLLSPALLSPQAPWPSAVGTTGPGAAKVLSWVTAGGKGPADVLPPRRDPHRPERPNLACFSHVRL